VVGIQNAAAADQFHPHCLHFHESVAFRFAMALPQQGQMRIQILFVIAIQHLQIVSSFIVPARGTKTMDQRPRFSNSSEVPEPFCSSICLSPGKSGLPFPR
jgi:hypothetical protein